MRKRKINLLIVSQDSSAMAGAEVLLTSLAKEFVGKGVDVSVLTNCKPFLSAQETDVTSIYVPFRLDIIGNIKGFIKFIFQLIPAVFWYGKIIHEYSRKENGLVLISGFSEKLVVTPLAKVFKLPVLWLEHGPLEELFQRNMGIPGYLYRMVEKFVPVIVTPSKNTKDHIIKEANIRKEKITVIHNGIELKREKEINGIKNKIDKSKKHIILGMLSRIQREKGQDTLIEVVSILKKDNIELTIVGEGPDINIYKIFAKDLCVDKYITFTNRVSEKRKWELYSYFDVFCFPTRWELEGFGIVLLEAMMMGVPIVASDFGPVPEVVGDAGLLVQPDAKSFSKGIEYILKNEKLRKELVEKGKKRVKDFDIRITAGKYLDVFNEVLILNEKTK
jgi:glycosyltransferase involved in cell wall biosynthesis